MEKSEFNIMDINIINKRKTKDDTEETNGDNNTDNFHIIKIRK